MKHTLLLTFLTCVARSFAALNGTFIAAGSIVESIGTLQFIRGKLVVDVDLDPPPELVKKLTEYEKMLGNLQEELQQHLLAYLVKNRKKNTKPIEHINERLNLKIDMTLRDITYLKKTNWMRNRRGKRGLIDAGGELLKGIFGTATDKEVQVIKKEIQFFTGREAMMERGYRGVLTDINENHNIITKIEDSLRVIMGRQMKIQTLFILNEVTVLLEEVNTLISELMRAYHLIEEVSHRKYGKALNKNNFPFLKYSIAKEYDQEITEKYGLYSPIPLTVETFNEYLSEAVLLGRLRNTNTIRISLPYVAPNLYNIWKFHPFPMKNANKMHREVMTINEPYAIISKDRQLVLTFDDEVFEYCSKPAAKYFACFPILIMKPTNRTTCAESILKQERVARCNLSPFTSDEPLLQWVGDERYLSASKPQKVVMICEDGEPQEKWLSEVTKIATPCEVKNQEIDIPSLRTLHKKTAYEFPVVNVSAPELEILPNLDEFQPPRNWIDPKWLNITSPKLRLTPIESYNHLTLALLWVIVVFVIIYLIRKGWKKWQRKRRANRVSPIPEVLKETTPRPILRQPQQLEEEVHYSTVRTPPQSTRRTRFVNYEVMKDDGPRIVTVEEDIEEDN